MTDLYFYGNSLDTCPELWGTLYPYDTLKLLFDGFCENGTQDAKYVVNYMKPFPFLSSVEKVLKKWLGLQKAPLVAMSWLSADKLS